MEVITKMQNRPIDFSRRRSQKEAANIDKFKAAVNDRIAGPRHQTTTQSSRKAAAAE